MLGKAAAREHVFEHADWITQPQPRVGAHQLFEIFHHFILGAGAAVASTATIEEESSAGATGGHNLVRTYSINLQDAMLPLTKLTSLSKHSTW